jgi:ComF family protein
MSSFFDLLYPPLCVGCGDPVLVDRRDSLSWLCAGCRLPWESSLITSHINRVKHFYLAHYQPSVRAVILRAKEENDRSARRILAQAISAGVEEVMLQSKCVVIAIPSSSTANRIRGYSHGDLLATTVGKITGVSVLHQALIELRRVRDQSGLSAKDRATNVANSFALSRAARNITSPVVVIDDVVTTGSSMREALRALTTANIPVLALISAVGTG